MASNIAQWWPAITVSAVIVTGKLSAAAGETILLTGIFTIIGLIIIHGPRYITAWADLLKAHKDEQRPSDDD